MTELLPVLMFLVFTLLILAGYPVAFTIGGTALGFGLYAFGMSFFDLLPLRVWGNHDKLHSHRCALIYIYGSNPGTIGFGPGTARDHGAGLWALSRWAGHIGGCRRHTSGVASTGIIGATVTTMGLIALPTMIRRGYQKELASGVVCASGTLGQIIPPSIVLVLVGDILGVSVGDLFLGALIPGVSLAGLYIIYLFVVSIIRPESMPPNFPTGHLTLTSTQLWINACKAVIPALALMLAVLGSIFFGIAAPTEAAAIGASGSGIPHPGKREIQPHNAQGGHANHHSPHQHGFYYSSWSHSLWSRLSRNGRRLTGPRLYLPSIDSTLGSICVHPGNRLCSRVFFSISSRSRSSTYP